MFTTKIFSQEVKKGDVAIVPHWEWVTIKNEEGVRNNNCEYEYDESCGIDYGGVLTVIANHNGSLLVKYATDKETAGTMCPSGAIFFISKKRFLSMTEEYNKIKEEKLEERFLVRKLLKSE